MKKTLLMLFMVLSFLNVSAFAETLTMWFAPDWKDNAPKAKEITDVLSANSGLTINPRIAANYPEILKAFQTDALNIVYVGSFIQATIKELGLGKALVQSKNGKEFYSGIMVFPKGQVPADILTNTPEQIAYAKGASSGESSAKAATDGKANIPTSNHEAACNAVKAGKATAAFVKNWWWESNKAKFPELDSYEVPDISIAKNPDNVITVSNSVSAEITGKIKNAAIANKAVFGATEMAPFDPSSVDFSVSLMKKGKIDPKTYSW